MKPSLISIAQIQPTSEVNGPGRRSVIWVQGCHKRCPGCWNPEYLTFDTRWTHTPESLFARVKKLTRDFSAIEGITFSGGEPFAQCESLLRAARLFKGAGLSLMAFSGHTRKEIESMSAAARALMELLDILVDGEYDRKKPFSGLWRSSANQTVHFLTDRYAGWRDKVNSAGQEFEVTLDSNSIRVTGFPSSTLLKNLKKRSDTI